MKTPQHIILEIVAAHIIQTDGFCSTQDLYRVVERSGVLNAHDFMTTGSEPSNMTRYKRTVLQLHCNGQAMVNKYPQIVKVRGGYSTATTVSQAA